MREIPATGSNAIISKTKNIFKNFIAFFQSTQNSAHFENEGQLHSFNILEVVDPDKCGYVNSRMPLFQNTLPESKCSRNHASAETCTAALLSQFSITLR